MNEKWIYKGYKIVDNFLEGAFLVSYSENLKLTQIDIVLEVKGPL